MAFPPQFIEELRARVALASVVGRRVKLTKKGREYQGLCPFHNEKTPSFTVNEDKGFFHCFGCGAHGDVIGFEMQTAHLSFPEAVEKLAALAGMEVPKSTPEERRQEERRATLHDVLDRACLFFERQLRTVGGREGVAYLKGRGLSEETIARFRLGWAPDSRDALKTALMSKECPEALLAEAGLLKLPEGGGVGFDYFRGRITFPITDRRGRVVAFGARTLGDGQPKYLNSPDTPLFHKGATLYGLAHAREQARELGTVVVAEGYMDVIALHQAGFAYAVAPLGTALTERQIEELWRLAPEPILCFDGDKAGQRAMARAAERGLPLLKAGHSLRFAILPAPEDPDSLIKAKGPQAMKAVLDGARPLIEILWALTIEGRPLDTPERKAMLEKDLAEKAFAIADKAVQHQYLRAFKDMAWQAFRPAKTQFAAKRRGETPRGSLRDQNGKLAGVLRPGLPQAPEAAQERLLLALLLVHPPLADEMSETLGETRFSDSTLDKLRQGILKHHGFARDLEGEAFCAHLRSDGFAPELDSLLNTDEFKIARPKAIFEAGRLWKHTFALYARKELLADVGGAQQRLADDMSEPNFGRFAVLKNRDAMVILDDDDDSGPSGV